MERIIRAATQAPSYDNTQPREFVVGEEEVHIFPDFSRCLPVTDPEYRELIISLGCALENLTVAARHEGYAVKTSIFPQAVDGIVAMLSPVFFPPDEEMEALFDAIKGRQTTRCVFDGQKLSRAVIDAISDIPLEEGVYLRQLTGRQDLDQVATLVRKADEFLLSKNRYRKELTDWIRFSRSHAEKRRDGLTAPMRGRRWVPEWLGRFILRNWVRAGKHAADEAGFIDSASGVLLFYTVKNDPVSWVRLGQSFERVALTLTRLGLKHAHHNQPCEVPSLRRQFRRNFGPEIVFPQLLVRIGYAEEMPRAPRRELEELIP